MFNEMQVSSGGGGEVYYDFIQHSGDADVDVGFNVKYAEYVRYDGLLNIYDSDVSTTTAIQYYGTDWQNQQTITFPSNTGLIRNVNGSKISIYSDNVKGYLFARG